MPVFKSERARRSWIQAVRVELLSLNPYCWYCGCNLPFAEWATIDHLTPRSRGGAEEPDNAVLSCKRCNRRKGARLLSEGVDRPAAAFRRTSEPAGCDQAQAW